MNVIGDGENVFQPFQLFIPIGFICRPESGSMLMYSRKKVRYRRDGYCWKKRKDGKTTREDHMKLKVQGVEVSVFLFVFIFQNPQICQVSLIVIKSLE